MRFHHLVLLLGASTLLWAGSAQGQEWTVLENCRIVPHPSNDGDSFRVRHEGEVHYFRLYFVDTPEDGLAFPDRVQQQADYFGISVPETLRLADEGTRFARSFMQGPLTIKTQWIDARGRSRQQRFYALVQNQRGEYLSTALVEEGLARVFGMPTRGGAWPGGYTASQYQRILGEARERARRQARGGWRTPEDSLHHGTTPDENRWLINVNKATAAQLEALSGVGPVIAERIIAARPFDSVEDLLRVQGIGPALLDRIRGRVRAEAPPPPERTADFYRQDPAKWLYRDVRVDFLRAEPLNIAAPDGFVVFKIETGTPEAPGGQIRLYLPEQYQASFLQRIEAGNLAELTAFFHDMIDIGPVLVVRP